MQGKENLSTKILRLCKVLPDFCEPFLLETGTELAYSTRLEYARDLLIFFDCLASQFSVFNGKKPKDFTLSDLSSITSQDISRYLTLYKGNEKDEKKDRTVARKKAALSSFFAYMFKHNKIPSNPVVNSTPVKIHKSDEVIHLNMNEQMRLLDSVDTGDKLTKKQQAYHDKYRLRDYALIMFMLDTGVRVSEIVGMDIADIDMENCSVLITRKGGNIQTIYFSDETRDVINDYLVSKKVDTKYMYRYNNPLFTNLKGERLGVRAVEKLVKKYAISSVPEKGKKISPHKLRSSFAMSLYREENDILLVQKRLGHMNISTTMVYTKALEEEVKSKRGALENARKRHLDEKVFKEEEK